MTGSLLEVWGDPIAHSLSPALHAAAYAELGWDWTYGRRRVDDAAFATELASLGTQYRGLSLTFPLKGVAYAASAERDLPAELTGAVNTLLLTEAGPRGFNTDVGGIVADVREQGVDGIDRARIVGAGATATSALVALAELGATHVEVVARRPAAAAPLVALGERLSLSVTAVPLDAAAPASVPVTISTLPGGADLPADVTARLSAGGGLLYDVVYGHWPTALATAWQAAGHPAVNGLGMLLQQAVRQIRIFATGEATDPLEREDAVVAVMRRAVMGD
ncbi:MULTISPECIES: shikimate dehydrogenase [unclassified Microbacterium]|uniref:shikimate dehydrogenase family protein n=1 Tax=unclassified Microbacterium TaxID=2609290 RepID=UPI000A9741C4|nr:MULTISPECIES: shikimate dehydrogenase [unclassified Microbacterium]